MGGYRDKGQNRPEGSSRPTDLVGEMVNQFASVYAFARELVQNSIDAGASEIVVHNEHNGVFGITSVSDDGSGMDSTIVQERLLTLFSSSKEDDEQSIGKYGVGFVSVFALDPILVRVVTSTGGERLELSLQPDHSYELERHGGTHPAGTVVELNLRMGVAEFENHVERVKQALWRWCSHVDVPIRFQSAPEAEPVSLNQPLEIKARVAISLEIEDERYALAVALGEQAHGSYYARGLLLAHDDNHGIDALEGVHFKVSSPRLAHTISRDDIRRDRAHKKVIKRVVNLAKTELRQALEKRLAADATRIAVALREGNAAPPELRHFGALLSCTYTGPTRLDPHQISWPLCPTAGAPPTMTLGEILPFWSSHIWCSHVFDDLTRALAKRSETVVYSPGEQVSRFLHSAVSSWNAGSGWTSIELRWVHEHFVHCVPVEPDTATHALCKAVCDALSATGHPVRQALPCRLNGPRLESFGLSLPARGELIAPRNEVHAWASVFEKHDTLFLDANHEVVQVALKKARRASQAGIRQVAGLLARLLLLECEGPAPAGQNDALLSHLLSEAT